MTAPIIGAYIAIACLLTLLALLAVAHVRQGWRNDRYIARSIVASARWRGEAIRWRDAYERLYAQGVDEVDQAAAEAAAVTYEDGLADLDEAYNAEFAEIIRRLQ